LFGHEKGAFTGAVARRVGKFEESSGGTLLLDEISEMDIRLQAKLLRAIQEKEIDRVGGTAPVKVDLRVIATSNRNLAEEVKKGTFREDLLYRLSVINIKLPSLRERKEDIVALADFFIAKYAKANGVAAKKLSEKAKAIMQGYNWKGNVLESADDAPQSMTEVKIVADEPQPESPQAQGLVGRTLESVEKELITSTLKQCMGNRTHAANILGISIRTLRNKLKEYQMDEAG
jgi:two-component system response regulator FlrC